MPETALLLGSNLGDSLKQLNTAITLIERRIGVIKKLSAIHNTPPWGKHDQPDFLNQALLVETALDPAELMKTILSIENEMGRIRHEKWGPRLIDIDILYYEDIIVNTPELIIPHPFMQERLFTLIPLSEISPAWLHPQLNINVTEILENLKKQ